MLNIKKTNKTASVLRMLTGEKPENPMLNEEFREDVLKPIEDLKKRSGDDTKPERTGRETEINITSELISEWLPSALDRFKCCKCSRCYAEASVAAFEKIEPIKVKVKGPEDLEKVEQIKEDNRRRVMMSLVSVAMARKNLPVHNK
ncbi:MAG: hypothetical protein SOU50_02910 [Oscillospiraceae bacterium]|nr:hypothetical protein [Oscillospiraceae bacterium]MDD7428983.1 hypothetical protein [Oscillospiraceae bacterium]MDY2847150.1 hypothetical protein [Oscillospiraceae bacterium]